MSDALILVEKSEGIATVTLNRPSTLNALSRALRAEITRVFDELAWEGAIQTVLDACNEFDLMCGYPAGPDNIEERMAQGFDVFVMNWGDSGFQTVEMGRAAASR